MMLEPHPGHGWHILYYMGTTVQIFAGMFLFIKYMLRFGERRRRGSTKASNANRTQRRSERRTSKRRR